MSIHLVCLLSAKNILKIETKFYFVVIRKPNPSRGHELHVASSMANTSSSVELQVTRHPISA
jgi:hypothetical protein